MGCSRCCRSAHRVNLQSCCLLLHYINCSLQGDTSPCRKGCLGGAGTYLAYFVAWAQVWHALEPGQEMTGRRTDSTPWRRAWLARGGYNCGILRRHATPFGTFRFCKQITPGHHPYWSWASDLGLPQSVPHEAGCEVCCCTRCKGLSCGILAGRID